MNVFQYLKHTDMIVSRLYEVRNDYVTDLPLEDEKQRTRLVLFQADDPNGSELLEHLPGLMPLSVVLEDELYTLPSPDMEKAFGLWKKLPRNITHHELQEKLRAQRENNYYYSMEAEEVLRAALGIEVPAINEELSAYAGIYFNDESILQEEINSELAAVAALTFNDDYPDTSKSVLPPTRYFRKKDNSFLKLRRTPDQNDSEIVESQFIEDFRLGRAGHFMPIPTKHTPGVRPDVGDVITRVSFPGKPPPPKEFRQGEASEVPELFLQILYGIRAMLITLIDAAGKLSLDGNDHLGLAPATNVFRAMDLMSQWHITEFVGNVKFWKDSPLASFLKNPAPQTPPGWLSHDIHPKDPLFGGLLGKFVKRLSSPTDGASASLLYVAAFAMAQSKTGFAAVPSSFTKASYIKHAEKLSTPLPDLSGDLIQRLKKFFKVFFRNFRPKDLIRKLSLQEGSTSSANTATRAQGGAREDLRSYLSHRTFQPGETGLVRMVGTDRGVIEERGILPPHLEANTILKGQKVQGHSDWYEILEEPLDFRYGDLPFQLQLKIPLEWRKYPFAKVIGLTEPLKVRLITKMQTLSSFAAKPFQKALFEYVKSFPCFKLIGETFSEELLWDLINRENLLFGERSGRKWVSGDYSAATDGLKLLVTRLGLEEASSKLQGPDQVLQKHLETVLMEQVLIYPPESNLPPVLQKEGQLMGSVLSFPFLCIINLFTYVESMPEEQRDQFYAGRLSAKSLPVLINGDDILYQADDDQYDRWLTSSHEVGFTLSLGKNFVHPRFFTVNSIPLEQYIRPPPVSMTFQDGVLSWRTLPDTVPGSTTDPISWADLDELPDWQFTPSLAFRVHEFIHVGLLLGLATAIDERARFELTTLAHKYRLAVTGSMSPVRTHGLFLHYNLDELSRQTRFGKHTLNIFAHPLLGGLGFPVPEGVNPRFSEPQRHLAYKLLESARAGYQGAIEDHPLSPFTRLVSPPTGAPNLGTFGGLRPVTTVLEAPIGPFDKGNYLYDPDIIVRATPLALDLGDRSDAHSLSPTCRLSDKELNDLLKSANHGRSALLSPQEMTSFPYRIVHLNIANSGENITVLEQGDLSPTDQPPHIPEPQIAPEYLAHGGYVPSLDSLLEALGARRERGTTRFPIPSPAPQGPPVVFDDSWEDDVLTPPPVLTRASPPPPSHPGRIRRQIARQTQIAQGLQETSTSNERDGKWSRKGKRRF